jgi:hypothetical protein
MKKKAKVGNNIAIVVSSNNKPIEVNTTPLMFLAFCMN